MQLRAPRLRHPMCHVPCPVALSTHTPGEPSPVDAIVDGEWICERYRAAAPASSVFNSSRMASKMFPPERPTKTREQMTGEMVQTLQSPKRSRAKLPPQLQGQGRETGQPAASSCNGQVLDKRPHGPIVSSCITSRAAAASSRAWMGQKTIDCTAEPRSCPPAAT